MDFVSGYGRRRCASVQRHYSFTDYVVVNPVTVFLAFHRDCDIQVLYQIFFLALEHAPNVIHRATTSLTASLVEAYPVDHTTSAAGTGQD